MCPSVKVMNASTQLSQAEAKRLPPHGRSDIKVALGKVGSCVRSFLEGVPPRENGILYSFGHKLIEDGTICISHWASVSSSAK